MMHFLRILNVPQSVPDQDFDRKGYLTPFEEIEIGTEALLQVQAGEHGEAVPS